MTYKEFISQIENFDGHYTKDINESTYFSFPIEPILEAESKLANSAEKSIAYFFHGIRPCPQYL